MTFTINLNPPEGGLLIAGSEQELRDFAEAITEAADGQGEIVGQLLTDDGVEDIRVVVEEV